MSSRSLLFAAALCATLLPQVAEARGFTVVRGTEEHLSFVAQTRIPAPGQAAVPGVGVAQAGKPLALCHYYERRTLYWLGYWISSNGYVLSDSDCEGDGYYGDPNLIAAAFADGALPADVPREPQFTLMQRVEGHTWFGIALVLLLAWAAKRALAGGRGAPRGASRMEERMSVLGLADDAVFRFIDAMLHAAAVDGRIAKDEIAYIRDKATELTELEYTDEHIEWAIVHTDRIRSRRDFQRFGAGLSEPQARMVLRAALAVVAADGNMSRKERRFIANLTAGLGLARDEADRILHDDGLQSPAAAPVPAQ